ncbi:hypothetical protein Tco_0379527 [Tanacetum coccineum]
MRCRAITYGVLGDTGCLIGVLCVSVVVRGWSEGLGDYVMGIGGDDWCGINYDIMGRVGLLWCGFGLIEDVVGGEIGWSKALHINRPTAKGVGLRVASSHTGNHREDDFTPIETIQRFLEVERVNTQQSLLGKRKRPVSDVNLKFEINRTSRRTRVRTVNPLIFFMDAKFIIASQTCTLTKDELSQLVTDYDIPQDVRMDFRSFMVRGIDGEFHFEPDGGFAGGEGNSPSNMSVNNEAPVIDVAPLNSSPPSHVAENVGDSNDVTLGEDIIGEAEMLSKSSKVAVTGDASDPLDVDNDPDIHGKFYTLSVSFVLSTCGSKLIFVFPEFPSAKELKDSADCHFVVAHVTPPSWKKHLRDISLEKLCDIHDKACIRQAILDNMLNSRTRQLMTALEKARALCDIIREREFEKDKAYAKLERKCNEALQDRDDLGCSFKGLILGVVVLL